MNRLEKLVQIPEMSAFRRYPTMRSKMDPWGSMGGWSIVQDLVYLDWLAEQEEEEEEVVEQRTISAWGKTTSESKSNRSAWFTTPYTPARVATKSPSSARRNRVKAPTLRPINRAVGRATVGQDRRQLSRQVSSSLPPMLSSGVGRRWVEHKSNRPGLSDKAVASAKTFKTPSPMIRMVEQEIQERLSDDQVHPLSLAQGRVSSSPKGSTLLPRSLNVSNRTIATNNVESSRQNRQRGLQTQVSKTQIAKNLRSVISTTPKQTKLDDSLNQLVQKSTIQTVRKELKRRVETVVRLNNIKGLKVQEEVSRLTPTVVEQVEIQLREIFSQANVQHLDDVIKQVGQSSSAVQRIQRVVSQVVETVVSNSKILTEDHDLESETVPNAVIDIQFKEIVQRLQRKGVSRSLAESALKSLPPKAWTSDIVEDLVQNPKTIEESPKNFEYRVQQKVDRLLGVTARKYEQERLVQRGRITTQRSVLPSVAGEELPSRLVTSLIQSISNMVNRETMIESSMGQQRLVQSVERAVDRMETTFRQMRLEPLNWVDIQQDQPESEQLNEEAPSVSPSPWFSGKSKEGIQQVGQSGQLLPVQQAASRVLRMLEQNPTRPELVARQIGMREKDVVQILEAIHSTTAEKNSDERLSKGIVNSDTEKTGTGLDQPTKHSERILSTHPLEHLWERATAPIALPEWRGTGTDSFTPIVGQSAKTWRLDPKKKMVHPSSIQFSTNDGTLLNPIDEPTSVEASNEVAAPKSSPWFTKKDSEAPVGFGFTPESISGDSRLTSNDVANLGMGKSVRLSASDVQGKKAQWLQPNRTVILDDGTVIHAKVARSLGIVPKRRATSNTLPLAWTLEGVQLNSDHQSLPGWAKRASGKPQVTASPDFLLALAKASSADDVAEVILNNSGNSDGVLPKTAMSAIEQIRREAHKGLERLQSDVQEQSSVVRNPRDRSKRRVSRTASAVLDGFTGLKPISTVSPVESGSSQTSDKVSKLAKQLESLVSLAENNRQDEAREGVRMAEDSHDAVTEGQANKKDESADHSADIEALRREVLSVFELELSLRSIRSFESNDKSDPWW
jgi:hypothetical protein